MAPRQGACPGATPGSRTSLRPQRSEGRRLSRRSAKCKDGLSFIRHGLRPGRPISNKSRTSLCGRVSKTQPAWGSTRATCQFLWGRGRKVMHLPCKQTQTGALPVASTILSRETRPKHRAKPHKLRKVGATPTPATIFREVIRLPDCKSGVAKQSRKRRTGALPALPTISGSVAQSAERPVVCGRVEGASPFGSAILSECSSVFRAPGLGPGDRR